MIVSQRILAPWLAIVLLGCSATGETRPTPEMSLDDIAGCYDVTLHLDEQDPIAAGERFPGGFFVDESGTWMAQASIPGMVMLIRSDRPDLAWNSVRALNVQPSYRAYPGAWGFSGRDSISIGWGDGYTGTVLHLRVSPDSLWGHAESWSDDQSLDERATAVLHRLDCATRRRSSDVDMHNRR